METTGIDLAAQDAKTAVCTISWNSRSASVAPPVGGADGVTEDALVEAVSKANWVGIDSPFGWPAGFVSAVAGYAERQPWPDIGADALRYRLTDRLVRDEVEPHHSASRPIGSASPPGAAPGSLRWRAPAEGRRPHRPRPDRRGLPGAALTRWGLDRRGYKASGNAERKLSQRSKRRRSSPRSRDPPTGSAGRTTRRDRCVESDDFLDAFLCALIARSAAVGLTVWPKKKKEWKAGRAEGWIHLPRPDSLPQLAGAAEKRPPAKS